MKAYYFKKVNWLALTIFTVQLTVLSGQQNNNQKLDLQKIMSGEKFIGYTPESIFWHPNSKEIYFSWNPSMDSLRSTFRVSAPFSAAPVKMPANQWMPFPPGGLISQNKTVRFLLREGDIYKQLLPDGQLTPFMITAERESNLGFAKGDSLLTFQKNNNLFSLHLLDGSIRQITNFTDVKPGAPAVKNAAEKWLEKEQLALFEVLDERKSISEKRKREEPQPNAFLPKPYFLNNKRLIQLSHSPDLKYVTCKLAVEVSGKETQVPDFVTASAFTTNLRSREKVGFPQPAYEMGIFLTEKDSFYLLNFKKLSGILKKPEYLRFYHDNKSPFVDTLPEPKSTIINGPVWSSKNQAVFVVRSQDHKDRWLVLFDPSEGKWEEIDHQHDTAWIGGPGIDSWDQSAGNIEWLPDGNQFYFQSEKTGFSHLYLYDVNIKSTTQLTSGNFEVLNATLSLDGKHIYVTANAEGPHQQHFYKLDISSKTLVKITNGVGNAEVTLSPDEKYLAIRFSSSNTPWELFVQENRPDAKPVQITRSTTAAFNSYEWRKPEIVWFKAQDGVSVPARIYKPHPKVNHKGAVIFVHGAGYLQNVHEWWSTYYREYMFHNLLADKGYTVMDIDYRGSAGYGRDWRTGIYRFMGGKDLSDQVDGARYLVEKYKVDPARIGIYGGSYGGFITLMALFNEHKVFKSGAALRSVTDWAHYNHGYTSNILNIPTLDPIAYKRSSPIYFAEGLKGNLLMLHGMVDVNVHFQDIVRLSQRLIELKKEHWELAVFPVEDHGFVETTSWLDEYRRILNLFDKTIAKPESEKK
ncbi:MAG: prolyl oligopeptidase family serine peptidase [Bacteroidetes bacterium]|nr:prolyl oligopeptidase family serine peptidase [Bacteroidota bacterium]